MYKNLNKQLNRGNEKKNWVKRLSTIEQSQSEAHKKYWANHYWKGFKGKILDVGCGTAWIEKYKPDNIEYFGIDKDADLVKFCKSKNINVKKASITKIPYDDNFFDGIFALYILEHLTPKECGEAFEEMHRVIKQGGIIKIIVPTNHKKFWDEFTHVRPYTKIAIRDLLECNGFEAVEIGYAKWIPLIGGLMVNYLDMPRVYDIIKKLSIQRDVILAVARKI